MTNKLANRVHNGADVVDSREVLDRIEELEAEIEGRGFSYFVGSQIDRDGETYTLVDRQFEADGEKYVFEYDDGSGAGVKQLAYPLDDAVKLLNELALDGGDDDEQNELKVLRDLVEEIDNNAGDNARDGVGLVRDSYFEQYAEQFADDIGAINKDAKWPVNHIDWKAAAADLQQDYTQVDWDGVTYWVRS